MENISNLKSAFSKRDVAYILFKRKSLILSVFILTTILVTVGCYTTPPSYKASSAVYITRNIPPVPYSPHGYFTSPLDRVEVITTEITLIKSRAVIEKVVDTLMADGKAPKKEVKGSRLKILERPKAIMRSVKQNIDDWLIYLGLVGKVDSREQMINSFGNNIKARALVDSNIVEISYVHEDQEFSAYLVNTVTRTYLEQNFALTKRSGIYDLYNDATETNNISLRELEEQSQNIKERWSIISIEDQKRLKLEALGSLNIILNQVKGEKVEIVKKIKVLESQMANQQKEIPSSRTIKRNPAIDEINSKLLVLESEKSRLLDKFTPGSRQVQEIDRAIEDMRRTLSQQPLTIVDSETMSSNSIRQELLASLYRSQADLEAKIAREITVTAQIKELEMELQHLEKQTIELKALSRSITNAEKLYFRYLDRREDAKIADTVDIKTSNTVRVMHFASVPQVPTYSRLFLIQVGAFGGLVVGIGLALAVEFYDHSLNNKEDVEYYLDLPLLASIPETKFNYHKAHRTFFAKNS